jgi:hypothetical protein
MRRQLRTKQNIAEIRSETPHKKTFLMHISKREEKAILDWFRFLLKLYGVSTILLEENTRVRVDWLQRSLDAIRTTDFVIVFLTKRYQFTYERGKIVGWKAPDKCCDEIAMSFASSKDLFAIVEKEVGSGRVLQDRACCYQFSR